MEKENVAGRAPQMVELKAGETYAWCACGLSENQPLCDGKHKGTGMGPLVSQSEKSETVYYCNCKATEKGPFCDGSHKN